MRLFTILVSGALVSSVGSGMTAFALGAWAFITFGTASSVAVVQLCALAPIVLLGPAAGALADRHDRRLLMALGDGGSVLGLLVVLVAVSRPEPRLPVVLVGVTVSACLASLTEPALRATVNDLVPAEQYARSSGLLQLISAAKLLVSPALAGLVLPRAGIATVLWIDVSTVAVTVACALSVRRRLDSGSPRTTTAALASGSVLAALRETARLLTSTRPVATAMALVSFLTVFIGVLQVLMGPVLLPNHPVSAVGTAQSVAATGMLAGALAVGALGRLRPAAMLTAGVLGLSAGMIAFALSPSLTWVTVCCFVILVSLALCSTGAEIVVRTCVPGDHQGRSWGLIGLVTQLGYLLAYTTAGPLADRLFEPTLLPDGALAGFLGPLVGTGPGRGTALLVAVFGLAALFLVPVALSPRLREVRAPQEVGTDATDAPSTRAR